MEQLEGLIDLVQSRNGIWKGSNASGFLEMEVPVDQVQGLLEILYRDKTYWCDFLISISGEHRLKEGSEIRIHYHLQSITRHFKFHLIVSQKVESLNQRPVFPTVSHIWKTANWHERETAELFGVEFSGHPDTRNLLLPSNWEGFPLRKDYIPQEEYHGVNVKY